MLLPAVVESLCGHYWAFGVEANLLTFSKRLPWRVHSVSTPEDPNPAYPSLRRVLISRLRSGSGRSPAGLNLAL
jgi:hypothetical protein